MAMLLGRLAPELNVVVNDRRFACANSCLAADAILEHGDAFIANYGEDVLFT